MLVESVLQTCLGQLGHNQQLTVHDLDAFQREQKRVTHRLDAIERFEFT